MGIVISILYPSEWNLSLIGSYNKLHGSHKWAFYQKSIRYYAQLEQGTILISLFFHTIVYKLEKLWSENNKYKLIQGIFYVNNWGKKIPRQKIELWGAKHLGPGDRRSLVVSCWSLPVCERIIIIIGLTR